jgi:hypothetical protein
MNSNFWHYWKADEENYQSGVWLRPPIAAGDGLNIRCADIHPYGYESLRRKRPLLRHRIAGG